MKNLILILAILVCLMGCNSGSDDAPRETTEDDDQGISEDKEERFDLEDFKPENCLAGIDNLYDCDFILEIAEGHELTEQESVAACEDGEPMAQCAAWCAIVAANYNDIVICYADNCEGILWQW